MFGYVKPFVPALRVGEYEYYKSVYCGLCRSMKRHTGTLSTTTLRYDFVFLCLFLMAIAGNDRPESRRGRCAVHPVRKRMMLNDNAALSYSAGAAALMVYDKVQDDLADSHGLKRMPLLAAARLSKKMRRRAGMPQALEDEIAGELQALSALEQANCPMVDEAAGCFGRLLGALFSEGCKEESAKRIAFALGFHVGKWIYFADAADDFPADLKQGCYNPLIAAGIKDVAAEKEMLSTAMALECKRAVAALDLISLPAGDRNGAILYNILYLGLPHRAEQILAHPGNKEKRYQHARLPVEDADETTDGR